MEHLPDTLHRVSTPERENTISRLQEAFIRGQLNDRELGERIDRALSAVVSSDLSSLVSDLPVLAQPLPVVAVRTPWWRRRKNESIYKSAVHKTGAWTVPEVFRAQVYKGLLIVDLRQAVLTHQKTVINLSVYKSRVAIIVPQDYNVELEGTSYKGSLENLTRGGRPGSPLIVVKGSAYKSSVVVSTQDLETGTS